MKSLATLVVLTCLAGVQAQSEECDCYAARLVCGSKPGANQAECTSEYAACLGYVPTDASGAVTVPSTCATASSTAPPASTTAAGKECQCYAARLDCGSKPGANQASCSSDYAACLGYIPTDSAGVWTVPSTCSATSTPTPTGSIECQCYAARQACGVKPGANQAECSAEYAACLGYVPTDSRGAVTVPSTCGNSFTPFTPITYTPTSYMPTPYTPVTYTPVTRSGSATTTPVKYTGAANAVAGNPLLVAAVALLAL